MLGPKSAPAEDDAVQEAISAVFQLLDAGLSAKDASAASIVFGAQKNPLQRRHRKEGLTERVI